MKHLFTYALILSGLLVGCGGPKNDSSSSTGVSSSSKSSSSTTTSASSSVSSLSGNEAAGKQVLLGGCAGCHQDAEEDGTFVGVFSFDVNRFTYQTITKYLDRGYTGASITDLTNFIDAEMPNCSGSCASNAATYLWSLRGQTPQVEQFACDASAPVLYGRRDLKLLTSFEYHNSLQALFNKPLPDDFSTQNRANSDAMIGRMPNHTQETVPEGRLTAYSNNAEELAEWATGTSGALSFSCSDANTCANNFINEFAYYAFRRPLTFAERDEYRGIISGPSDLQQGLKWAIRSVLMSPQFLYRSELGTKVSEARNAAPEQPGDDDLVQGDAVSISMPEITYSADGMGEYGAYKYTGTTPANLTWSGDDIVIVSVKANGAGGGVFGISINNGAFKQEVAVNSTTPQVLTYRITGITGASGYIQTYNQSNNAISVSKISVGPAVMPEIPSETIPKLDVADSSAYVLNAFEYAGALSYMFTGSSPDRELMRAAFAGELSNKGKVEQQIDRMLDSDQGKQHIGRMAGIWFRTDGVVEVNRTGNDNFTQDVKNSMAQEIRELFKYVFYNDNEPFKSIYTGNFTMLDSILSDYYGIPGGGNSPMTFARVDTSNSRRGGVIASGAYMASNAAMSRTSPIFRAVHMRQDVLCQAIALPNNLNDTAARDEAAHKVADMLEQGTLTTAEFYNIQTTIPGSSCATCHNAIINPLFAMDDFDNVGLPRKIVGGKVVQRSFTGGVTGESGADTAISQVNEGGYLYSAEAVGLLGSAEADREKEQGGGLKFSGSKNLGQVLVSANLPGLDACLFEKTARFALGHSLNPAFEDKLVEKPLNNELKSHMTCINEDMESAYQANNGSPRAAMKALGLSDAIRYRR